MGTLVIKADNPSSKILKKLAEHMGASVAIVQDSQLEDLIFGNMLENAKTGKNASKDEVFKNLKGK